MELAAALGPEQDWSAFHRVPFLITRDVCVVGRGNDVDLQLDDVGVSRRHALLRVIGQELWVEDLTSRNGTYVNGEPIDRPVALQLGDELAFGPCELRVAVASPVRSEAECTTQRVPRVPGRSRRPTASTELPHAMHSSSESQVTASQPRERDAMGGLSPRERELLPLLASGYSQRELAAQLGVTVKTIETYRTRIGHKLGLTSRAGLVRFALDHGLLQPQRS